MKAVSLSFFFALLLIPFASAYNFPGYSSYSRYSYYRAQEPEPIISLDLDPQHLINASFRIAARENRLEDVLKFLKEGADINSVSDSGRSALMFASENCMVSVAQTLLQMNADVNLKDRDGDTALVYATAESCLPIVKSLLHRRDLELNERDKSGKTVFDYATDCASLDVGGPASEILRLLNRRRRHS